jgi:DNA-binding XRE family transcriptional regulator
MKKHQPPGRLAAPIAASYDPQVTPGQGRDGPRAPRVKRASDLGRRLTARRDELRWTQAQLAEHLGVAVNSVRNWELGTSAPRGLYLKAVERFLARK